MRIALIGGSGFIGGWLVRCGRPEDRFIIVDRVAPPNDIAGRVEFRPADLLGRVSDEELAGVEGVVLLAARRPPARWYPEAAEDYLANIRIAANALEACRRRDITNVVFTSTISVYGRGNRVPFDEAEPARPNGYYGLSKVAVEQLADCLSREQGLAVKCLRLAHLVGAGERESFMLMRFARRAMNREPLLVYGRGEGRREYVYVKDVADAVFTALAARDAAGVYNIGTGVSTSHRELAEAVTRAFDSPEPVRFAPDKPEDTTVDGMNVTRAATGLNWRSRPG